MWWSPSSLSQKWRVSSSLPLSRFVGISKNSPVKSENLSWSVVSDSLPPRGLLQAKILEWVAISISKGSSPPKDQTLVSWIPGRCFTIWATREAQNSLGFCPFRGAAWNSEQRLEPSTAHFMLSLRIFSFSSSPSVPGVYVTVLCPILCCWCSWWIFLVALVNTGLLGIVGGKFCPIFSLWHLNLTTDFIYILIVIHTQLLITS